MLSFHRVCRPQYCQAVLCWMREVVSYVPTTWLVRLSQVFKQKAPDWLLWCCVRICCKIFGLWASTHTPYTIWHCSVVLCEGFEIKKIKQPPSQAAVWWFCRITEDTTSSEACTHFIECEIFPSRSTRLASSQGLICHAAVSLIYFHQSILFCRWILVWFQGEVCGAAPTPTPGLSVGWRLPGLEWQGLATAAKR